MLNIIDRLPPNSHTNAAIAQDEEHVKMMVDAGLKPAKGVSQIYYGSVEQRLDTVADLVARVGDLVIATNARKGKRTPPTKAQPRPTSAFTRLRHEARLSKHQALSARLLPNGSQIDAEPARRVAGQRRRDRRVAEGAVVVAPGSSNTFIGKATATRDDERNARWADRAKEVGRVPDSNPPVT